jgi:hypothetical protein
VLALAMPMEVRLAVSRLKVALSTSCTTQGRAALECEAASCTLRVRTWFCAPVCCGGRLKLDGRVELALTQPDQGEASKGRALELGGGGEGGRRGQRACYEA